jgi:hypothetical protein
VNENQFREITRRIIQSCAPDELDAFDLAADDILPDIYRGGRLRGVRKGGDAEFAPIDGIKTALEFVPLLAACYTIFVKITPAVKARVRSSPSAKEIEEELIRAGVDAPPSAAVAAFQKELESLTV